MNVKGTGFDISDLNYQWLFGVEQNSCHTSLYKREEKIAMAP